MRIELVDLNIDNWRECSNLQVAEGQEGFVAPNMYSIAQSKFIPGIRTRAIYADGTMVGFIMYNYRKEHSRWWVSRFMIDRNHQGKGYGKAAMQEAIRHMWEEHPGVRIGLDYRMDNEVARRLYSGLGFKESGEMIEQEVIAWLEPAGGKEEA